MRAVFGDIMFIRLFGAVALERFLAAVKSPEKLKIPSLQAYTKAIALCSHVACRNGRHFIHTHGNFREFDLPREIRENFGHYGIHKMVCFR